MSQYEKAILNALMDKYERSKSFTGDNKINRQIVIKIAQLFPNYSDHDNFELFQAINEAIDVLARKKLVTAKINKASVCSDVHLNIDQISQAYHYIGRTPKKSMNDSVLKILDVYMCKNEILDRFCEKQVERIKTNKPIHFFNEDLKEFENILHAVDLLLKVDTETFYRDFSIRAFKDSKVFDRISPKVVSLLFEYGEFPEKDQVLETLNIVRNPTYVNFKGAGSIVLSGQRINLNSLKSDIAISSALLEDIDRINITGKSVMTIENLTSFHTTDSKESFLIYLGGFHNRIRREFIKKIYKQNPEVAFYHFGDIDAGGFHIFEHLRRQTGIDFKPYKMDLETLRSYQEFSKSLTENDRDRLIKLKGREFDEVIEYMLEQNCKLEQEAVQFSHGTI